MYYFIDNIDVDKFDQYEVNVNFVFVHLGSNYPLHMFVAIKQAIKYSLRGRL